MTMTDASRWRLQEEDGRHLWHYLRDDALVSKQPQSFAENYFLGTSSSDDFDDSTDSVGQRTASQAAEASFRFFTRLQMPSGHWPCEFTGPNVNIPGIVIALHVTGLSLAPEEAIEITRYLFSIQRPDGGWALHIAGESSAYGTAMSYLSLRLLGTPPDHPDLVRGRNHLRSIGGVLRTAMIGKFWLAVLGVMDWNVIGPMPPEIWLLPEWLPFAPWRWWVYPRVLYSTFGFIWSKRWTYPAREKDPIVRELRQELFGDPLTYRQIPWDRYMQTVAHDDNFHPVSWVLALLYWLLSHIYVPYLRTASIATAGERAAYRMIKIDDENTDHGSIAAIAAPLALLARYIQEGPESKAVAAHRRRIHDFFWMTRDGMAVNVTSGVQTWDTAFAVQAAAVAGLAFQSEFQECIDRAHGFFEQHQMDAVSMYKESSVVSDPPSVETCASLGYRHPRHGAWGFSDKRQGYPVSDCTAEALTAVLKLQYPDNQSGKLKISERRLQQAVDILLIYQTPSTGGCSCYEPRRGGSWLESLNPSQVFDDLMVAYDYPECTGSCVVAVQAFRERFPTYRTNEIANFLRRAVAYLHDSQREDGSWHGSWGICSTYAAFFTLRALGSQGKTYDTSVVVQKACDFLVRKQHPSGGWGESYQSCVTGKWHDHPEGPQVAQTAWAVIALIAARYPHREVLDQAVRLLLQRQQSSGEFLQEDVEGAHQRSCAMRYPNYRFIFPMQALGMYAKLYENVP